MIEHSIPGGTAGTIATLRQMADLAQVVTPDVVRLAHTLRAEQLDTWLGAHWTYVPDGDAETLRQIPVMMQDFANSSRFSGDCDDAATLVASILFAMYRRGLWNLTASFVAVRPPTSTMFEHVFVIAYIGNDFIRIDPTAPSDADYSQWETLALTLF